MNPLAVETVVAPADGRPVPQAVFTPQPAPVGADDVELVEIIPDRPLPARHDGNRSQGGRGRGRQNGRQGRRS